MISGRRMALDFGKVRIGVAITDLSGLLPSPNNFVENTENVKKELESLITEFTPIYIAIGMPKHLSGESSKTSSEVLDFVEILKSIYPGPIYAIDERFSTKAATRKLHDAGYKSREMKGSIDSVAAVGILETALEWETSKNLEKCAI